MDEIRIESYIRAGWILFGIGLFCFSLGIGYLLVGFIVIGVIELGIAGFLGYKVIKELNEREKRKKSNLNEMYARETIEVGNDDSRKMENGNMVKVFPKIDA